MEDRIDFGGGNRYISHDEFKKIGASRTDLKGKHKLMIRTQYRSLYGSIDSVCSRKKDDTIVIYRAAANWFNIKFPTLDSLNSFIKNSGLEVQEEVQPQEVAPEDSVKQK